MFTKKLSMIINIYKITSFPTVWCECEILSLTVHQPFEDEARVNVI
jgi:hypothetical protein